MSINLQINQNGRISQTRKKYPAQSADDLHQLAFDYSYQAHIISTVNGEKIITANAAACRLLGYGKKELLTKTSSEIFDVRDNRFKKMLQQRNSRKGISGILLAINKNNVSFPVAFTSAIFTDRDGSLKAVSTIADLRESRRRQRTIDIEKEKIVAGDIIAAKAKQKGIDTRNRKKVADDIVLAKAKQKEIDIEKEKIVASDITVAKAKQKGIDTRNRKIVADNIILAKSRQKKIDIKKEKIIAHDILEAIAKSDSRLQENNEWLKLISLASYDVMWDYDITTGEIYVGDSVKEVFGYPVQNNKAVIADFSRCLLTDEKQRVEEKFSRIIGSAAKTWDDTFSFRRFDESVAAVASRATIVRDDSGNPIRLIGATKDVSKLQQLQHQLDLAGEESEKFLLASKLSFDVIWELNVMTNEIFLGEGFNELFGYNLENHRLLLTEWGFHLHAEDREAVEKSLYAAIASPATHWEESYRFICADKSIAHVLNRATILRNADGTAFRMIGSLQDISRQKELEKKLELEIASKGRMLIEYKERFRLIYNSSDDILYDIDLISNEIILSDAYEKEFGYSITGNMTQVTDWANHIHADDKESVILDYMNMLSTDATEWKYAYRFLKADGSVVNVLSSAVILRNLAGSAYRMIGSMHDISKQEVLEEQQKKNVRLKENEIAEAMREAKETERSDIGRELHDNVNQLLGVSRLFLDMAKRGGKESEGYLNRSSQYTLNAIEEIRKLSKGLTTDTIKQLGLADAIENACFDTMQVNKVKITCSLDNIRKGSVTDKFELNLFRIVQEQLNNILKHAKASEVNIRLAQNENTITLVIVDNGRGFNTSQKRKGIGLDNIQNRAIAFNGIAEFSSSPGSGCTLTVSFPDTCTKLV